MRTLSSGENEGCFPDWKDILCGGKGVNQCLEEGKCRGLPPREVMQSASQLIFNIKQGDRSECGGMRVGE